MTYERVTLMFSLPRSMTQWWAWFFGHGCTALHDPLAYHGRPDGLKDDIDAIEGRIFIADTSAIFFHDRLVSLLPGVQRIYNIRNVDDIKASLYRQTGSTWSDLINDQYERLERHAWRHVTNRRLYYGVTPEALMHMLVREVCGTAIHRNLQEMLNTRIDVPLAKQYRNHYKVRSLMGYKE